MVIINYMFDICFQLKPAINLSTEINNKIESLSTNDKGEIKLPLITLTADKPLTTFKADRPIKDTVIKVKRLQYTE
jgi:hypothetical protein